MDSPLEFHCRIRSTPGVGAAGVAGAVGAGAGAGVGGGVTSGRGWIRCSCLRNHFQRYSARNGDLLARTQMDLPSMDLRLRSVLPELG